MHQPFFQCHVPSRPPLRARCSVSPTPVTPFCLHRNINTTSTHRTPVSPRLTSSAMPPAPTTATTTTRRRPFAPLFSPSSRRNAYAQPQPINDILVDADANTNASLSPNSIANAAPAKPYRIPLSRRRDTNLSSSNANSNVNASLGASGSSKHYFSINVDSNNNNNNNNSSENQKYGINNKPRLFQFRTVPQQQQEEKENHNHAIPPRTTTASTAVPEATRRIIKRKLPPSDSPSVAPQPLQQRGVLRRFGGFAVHRDENDVASTRRVKREHVEDDAPLKRRKAVTFQAPQPSHPPPPASRPRHAVDDIVVFDDISDPMELDGEDDEAGRKREQQEAEKREEMLVRRAAKEEENRRILRRKEQQKQQPLPPSVLTALLLSHSNPKPRLPELPSPPRSRLGSSPAGSRVVTPLPSRRPQLQKQSSLRQLQQPHLNPIPQPQAAPAPVAPINPTPQPSASQNNNAPRTFSLNHLPEISHHTETMILTLHPPTHVTLTIRHSKPPTTYTIYPGDGGVTVHDIHYSLPELPWKHLSAFRYARRFVEFVASRTVIATCNFALGSHPTHVVGRMWADLRAEVEFPGGVGGAVAGVAGGVMIRVNAEGMATVGRGDLHAHKWHLMKAVEVWQWLKDHPDEPSSNNNTAHSSTPSSSASNPHRHHQHHHKTPPSPPPSPPSSIAPSSSAASSAPTITEDINKGWDIDRHTRFVKNVGWCKADEEQKKWWMRFLDGVRMLVFGDGRVLWCPAEEVVGSGRWTGLQEEEVRRRVEAFVEAGI